MARARHWFCSVDPVGRSELLHRLCVDRGGCILLLWHLLVDVGFGCVVVLLLSFVSGKYVLIGGQVWPYCVGLC